MDTQLDEDLRQEAVLVSKLWWVLVLTGLLWFLVSLIVLRFDTASVATVGVLLGFVLLGAGASEIMEALAVPDWRWVHGLMGGLFVVGAVWAFLSPEDVFWSLASVLGLLLVLKGALDIVMASEMRGISPMWGLGLAVGIFEVLLGFWASQQYYPARAALILIWVAFMAMFRGIGQIILGIQLRHAGKALAPA